MTPTKQTASSPIDLRSDTVTKPTPAMRDAMANAEVGDDVYGEDPTVQRLEATVAELLGKEAALFVSSGTMGNQLAILAQVERGDEILVGEGAHCAWYETGAASALAGAQAVVVGVGGLYDAEAMAAAVKPTADWYPRTALVTLENTHNRAGGRVWPLAQARGVIERAHALGLRVHMDGARLWNAVVALDESPAALASGVDSVSVCFSKGLGAPVGSALCGSRALVAKARRLRKMLGGGLRQSGILAAAALYALAHHRQRLAQDHDNAHAIAKLLAQEPTLRVDEAAVETNIVMVDAPGLSAAKVAEAAARLGVLVSVFGQERLRLVTHLDVASTALRGAELVAEAARAVTAAR